MARAIQVEGMKYCKSCDTTKSIDEFYLRNKTSMVRHSTCKECDRKRVKENHDPIKYREQHLKRTYGITQKDYELMLAEQNNQCAICNTTEPGGRHNTDYFVVDHCHTTGKNRKLLCHNCNTAMGLLGDNVSVIESMIKYLEQHKANVS
jgi:hypothetical protein